MIILNYDATLSYKMMRWQLILFKPCFWCDPCNKNELTSFCLFTSASIHSRSTTSLSIIDDHGPSPEPPPPITFEQLHNEARAVASRVLNRPQSGSNFVEDARTALAMWADRLSTLLDPPRKGVTISSC